MDYNFGFFMDQIAGHITNYRNLRSIADRDATINAKWHEIFYYKTNGAIERTREHFMPFVSTYVTGVMRGTLEMKRALHDCPYDALMSNVSVGVFFSRTFGKYPTLIDTDSTPRQIDQMDAYDSNKKDTKPVTELKLRLSRAEYNSATLIQAWSNWAKQSIITDYGISAEKIVVNPPGINLQKWKPGLTSLDQEQKRPLRVLFVGGDFHRKGGLLLLEWYKSQSPDKCELHIVTKEPVDRSPGIYVYHNMQPNSEELINLYQNSDLFVLPSLGECFGIANIEAMGVGLPVIASDVGGIADIIEPGRNGFIVPANNVHALSEAIESILSDADRREEMGRQSRVLATQRFDLQANARCTLSFMKQIADAAADKPKR